MPIPTEGRAHAQYPAFAANPLVLPSGSSEMAVKLFGPLYLSVHNLPQLHMHIVIFSPYSFFVFCFWRRGLSRCKHCSNRSQVPGLSEDKARSGQEANGFPNIWEHESVAQSRHGLINGHKNSMQEKQGGQSQEGKGRKSRSDRDKKQRPSLRTGLQFLERIKPAEERFQAYRALVY